MNAIPNSESISPSQARATVHAFSSKRDSPGELREARLLWLIELPFPDHMSDLNPGKSGRSGIQRFEGLHDSVAQSG